MKRFFAHFLSKHLVIFAVIAGYVLLREVASLDCPFRFLFGIPCPTCGMTHAMLSLFRLDFRGYMQYHAMALPFTVALLAAFHKNRLPLPQKAVDAFVISVSVATFVFYLVHILF